MVRSAIVVCLVAALAAISFSIAQINAFAAAPQETEAVVTGMVTARDGSIVTLKTDEGRVYTVYAQDASVHLDRLPGNCMSLRVGDKMKVSGLEIEPGRVWASAIYITLPPAEAAATSMPTGSGAGPSDDNVRLPSAGEGLGSWRGRGLVVDVKYRDRLVTIVTSTGTFVIDARTATIAKASRTVSIADINDGDAVRVWGEISGLNKVLADRLEIIQEKNRLQSAVPLKSVAAKGVITNIDYPSFTFKIDTGAGELRFAADENTFIHVGVTRKAFQDLKLGQQVKVVGMGNLTSGFSASEILVVGAPRG